MQIVWFFTCMACRPGLVMCSLHVTHVLPFFLTLFQFFQLLQHFVNSCLADVALYFIQFQYLPHFVGFGKVFPHRQTSCLQELAECVGCKFCDVAMFDEEQHDLVPLQTAAQQAVRADLFCDLALHEMFGVCEHGHLA